MQILVPVLIVSATAVIMELVAWSVHKYIMHSWGWGWHKSHHEQHDDMLERNDLFAIVFAVFAFSIMLVSHVIFPWLYWVGVGMSLYGVLYFIVHDGLTHNRWPVRYIPKKGYLKRLVQAHRLHHAIETPDHGVSFGFLYAPPVQSIRRQVKARAKFGQKSRSDQFAAHRG